MLRKRQRQELSDAIAGEMDTHGVVNDDEDGGGESKTASFKKSKTKKPPAVEVEQDIASIAPAPAEGKKKRKGGKGGVEEAVGTSEGDGAAEKTGDNADGEKQGRTRKARRKRSKAAATEVAGEEAQAPAAEGEAPSQSPATAVEQASSAAPSAAAAGDGEATAAESKKQRRGWGKARSKSTVAVAAAAAGSTQIDNGTDEGRRNGTVADERRHRKKTRSKQKNIRKDKRPMEQRPAHLRAGDPEYCGRGLTEETRTFLGLPEQTDIGEAPPAGWGQPGKMITKTGWVIDKNPRRLPKHLVPDSYTGDKEGGREVSERGVAAASGESAERDPAPLASMDGVASSAVKSKSKYKNLALPPGPKITEERDTKVKRSRAGGERRKRKGKKKEGKQDDL